MAVVETSLNFLKRDELYEREKPYQLKYAPAEGIPISNLRLEKQHNIKITSIRDREAQFTFEKNGFTVLRLNEDIPYDEFSNPDGIRRYLDMVSTHLKNLFGADKVQAFQYVIRKRDPGFPVSKQGQNYDFNQPSTVAHIDSTPEEAVSTFRQVNGDPAKLSPDLRYQVVNVWKPLRGPLRDWPLALCDAASVQPDHLTATDVVFAAKVTENLQVYHDAAHRWYYLEDQEPSELLVFRQSESHPTGRVGMLDLSLPHSPVDAPAHGIEGVPHSAFPNPLASADELPRESIEVRTLVSYGKIN